MLTVTTATARKKKEKSKKKNVSQLIKASEPLVSPSAKREISKPKKLKS